MLVLESLEKAEAEVVDELLGETEWTRVPLPHHVPFPRPPPNAPSLPGTRWVPRGLEPLPRWASPSASCPAGKARADPRWGSPPPFCSPTQAQLWGGTTVRTVGVAPGPHHCACHFSAFFQRETVVFN